VTERKYSLEKLTTKMTIVMTIAKISARFLYYEMTSPVEGGVFSIQKTAFTKSRGSYAVVIFLR